jgi:fumarate reductase flavoprotein subunit
MAMEIGASDRGTVAFEWNANRFPWLSMQLPYYISAIVEIMDSGRHPSPIWVNQNGKRFADESNSQSVNSLYTQLRQVCHTIFDESIKQKILSQPPVLEMDTPLPVRLEQELAEQAERGRVKVSDSWNEIAKFIGVRPEVLKATIDEYNSLCDKGYDSDFLKDAEHLIPLRNPPYYAIESRLNMLLTRGPLKVSHRMEVLDKEFNPIPGLYAAGVDIGGTDTDTYCSLLQAHSTGFTISSGRIAAENAVKYIS